MPEARVSPLLDDAAKETGAPTDGPIATTSATGGSLTAICCQPSLGIRGGAIVGIV